MHVKRLLPAALCGALLCSLSGCGKPEEASADFFAMDTVMSLTVHGAGAAGAVAASQAEVNRLESLLSRTRTDSEVSALNSGGGTPVRVSSETAALLNAAWSYSQNTDGAFDITIAPVVSAWGFTTEEHHVPTQAQLDALLKTVDYQGVLVEGTTTGAAVVTLGAGQSIDLGGIAKGYASDCVASILAEDGIFSAKILLGGNIYVKGAKIDGAPWRVAVQDPKKPDGFAGVLLLTDAFAITSGGYQRYFRQDGKTYHHIIDPATGYPANGGLTSVTVVADGDAGRGTMCDALSTSLFVMGEDDAITFWRDETYPFEFVFITDDDRVLVSEGIADHFEQETNSGYTYETVGCSAP